MTPIGGSQQEIPDESSSENTRKSVSKLSHNASHIAQTKRQNQMDKKQSHTTLNEKLNKPFKHQDQRVDKELDAMSPLECTDKRANQPNDKSNFFDDSFTHQVHHGGVVHPNFDLQQTPLDPDRSLSDIPNPVPRYETALQHILQSFSKQSVAPESSLHKSQKSYANAAAPESRFQQASPWALIASPDLASHLELLQVAGLIDLTADFFEPVSLEPVTSEPVALESGTQDSVTKNSVAKNSVAKNSAVKDTQSANKAPIDSKSCFGLNGAKVNDVKVNNAQYGNAQYNNALLSPLTQMQLLDLSDIYNICHQYPQLNRYGVNDAGATFESSVYQANTQLSRQQANKGTTQIPEMINDIFSPNWEVILYPERFDNGIDSLTTDILTCSAAVHILKQCQTRKTINRGLSVRQICQHMRSYVLSQCNIYPQHEKYYRQIRLFSGHVIFAAYYLNFKVSHSTTQNNVQKGHKSQKIDSNIRQSIHLNVSSRSSLFIRYPDISRYYINGWS